MITIFREGDKITVETSGPALNLLAEMCAVIDAVRARFEEDSEGEMVDNIILRYMNDHEGFRRLRNGEQ